LVTTFGHDLADTPPIATRRLRALSRFDAISRLRELSHRCSRHWQNIQVSQPFTLPSTEVCAIQLSDPARKSGKLYALLALYFAMHT
jgi:hypothetical protein